MHLTPGINLYDFYSQNIKNNDFLKARIQLWRKIKFYSSQTGFAAAIKK